MTHEERIHIAVCKVYDALERLPDADVREVLRRIGQLRCIRAQGCGHKIYDEKCDCDDRGPPGP